MNTAILSCACLLLQSGIAPAATAHGTLDAHAGPRERRVATERASGGIASRLVAAITLGAWTTRTTTAGDDPPIDIEKVEERALSAARAIDPEKERALALTALARAQARLGRVDAARATLAWALGIADQHPDDAYGIRRHAALAQALAGQEDEAIANRRLVVDEDREIADPSHRSLSAGVQKAVDGGDLAMAREYAAAMTHVGPIQSASLYIADEAARQGRLELALDSIARAEAIGPQDPKTGLPIVFGGGLGYIYAVARARLALALARADRRAEARNSLARAEAIEIPAGPPFGPAVLQAHLAVAYRALGDEEGTRKALARADALTAQAAIPRDRVNCLMGVAWILGEGGMPDAARDRVAGAERVEVARFSSRVLNLGYTAIGEWGRAREALNFGTERKRLSSTWLDDLARLARAQSRSGDGRGVLAWIDTEARPDARVYALAGLLEGIADRKATAAKP